MRSGLVRDEIPERVVGVAKRQARTHLDEFGRVGYNLEQLLVNVYLQGARDMADTLIIKGWARPTKEEVGA